MTTIAGLARALESQAVWQNKLQEVSIDNPSLRLIQADAASQAENCLVELARAAANNAQIGRALLNLQDRLLLNDDVVLRVQDLGRNLSSLASEQETLRYAGYEFAKFELGEPPVQEAYPPAVRRRGPRGLMSRQRLRRELRATRAKLIEAETRCVVVTSELSEAWRLLKSQREWLDHHDCSSDDGV